MNVIDLEHGLIGCFGIVGGSIAAATGAALALKRRDGVAVAFFGDGATNQGYFHECLNFAKVLELPVVFVCENNLYGEFTPLEESRPAQIRRRARDARASRPSDVDGNDVWAVRDAARAAVERARGGGGPRFIEALHLPLRRPLAQPTRASYRKPGELDEWKARDPLIVARGAMLPSASSDSGLEDVDAAVEAEIERIVARALEAALPRPARPRRAEFTADALRRWSSATRCATRWPRSWSATSA